MKHISTLLFCYFLSFNSFSQSTAPEVISSSGTSYNNASGQIDWTLGEPVTATLTSGSDVLTQGFHQPNLSITTGIVLNENDGISVYPNPTVSAINVLIPNTNENTLIELFDLNGKRLYSDKASAQSTIDMSTYTAGTYLLSIKESSKNIRTYQIIKSH